MTNPFITNQFWAMHESNLRALVNKADIDWDDQTAPDDDTDESYQNVNGVAVMSMCGPLSKYEDIFMALFGGASTLATKELFTTALDDASVNAILLVVDSPGGMVSGTGDLADAIANSSKPVWVYVSDMCASAAYWIAAQADKIYANPTAQVGSIGVYSVLEDTSGLYQKAGVKVNLVKAGDFKGVGEDGVPITDEQVADVQREINEIYSLFVKAVATGRNIQPSEAVKLATGQVWIAAKAKANGLIDGVASLDQVFGMLSGGTMAKKNVFGVNANATVATNAVASVATEVKDAVTVEAPAVEVVEAPAVDAVDVEKVESVEAPKADAVEKISVDKAQFEKAVADAVNADNRVKAAKAEGYDDGIKAEQTRLNELSEIAPDNAAFVLEQFKAGQSRGNAAIAYAKLLTAQNKELRTALASNVKSQIGANAVAIATADVRDAIEAKKSEVKGKGFEAVLRMPNAK